MSPARPGLSDGAIEAALRDLGDHLDDGADLAGPVMARLRTLPEPTRRRRFPASRRPLATIAAGVVAVALLGAVTAVPAVGDWLGIRGADVHQSPPPASVPPGLDLGHQVALPDVEAITGFAPLLPTGLGPPRQVWIDDRGSAPVLSLVFPEDVLISEVDASIGTSAVIQKFAGPDATVEELTFRGHRALWVEGPHSVALQTKNGLDIQTLRTSADALLFEHGNLTVRVETSRGRSVAIGVAESIPE